MTVPISPGITDVSGLPVRRPSDRGKYGPMWQPGMDRQNPAGGFGPHPGSGPVVITVKGPVFNGDFRGMLAAMVDEIAYRVAAQALERVQFNLDRSIQFPTPYYETQVMVQQVVSDWMVHDRGIVYGPWLEGVSHRNQTTRFKGYHSFRRAADEVRQHHTQRIGQQVVAEFVREMT